MPSPASVSVFVNASWQSRHWGRRLNALSWQRWPFELYSWYNHSSQRASNRIMSTNEDSTRKHHRNVSQRIHWEDNLRSRATQLWSSNFVTAGSLRAITKIGLQIRFETTPTDCKTVRQQRKQDKEGYDCFPCGDEVKVWRWLIHLIDRLFAWRHSTSSRLVLLWENYN